jgi:hypothetical protein
LRTYGVAQLNKENCRRRLSDLSTKQLRELIARNAMLTLFVLMKSKGNARPKSASAALAPG